MGEQSSSGREPIHLCNRVARNSRSIELTVAFQYLPHQLRFGGGEQFARDFCRPLGFLAYDRLCPPYRPDHRFGFLSMLDSVVAKAANE